MRDGALVQIAEAPGFSNHRIGQDFITGGVRGWRELTADIPDTVELSFTAWGFIYVAWSFTLFYWFGNAAGNRALSIGDNALGESDLFGVIGFLPGLPSVILVVVLLAIGARAVLTEKD